jgi:RNA polymerase sigma-70 factor (ECF subfamily)
VEATAVILPWVDPDRQAVECDSSAATLSELLVRSGQGDEAAFGRLYDATSRRVYSLALRRFPRVADAEDATRNIYVTLWRQARRFSPAQDHALAWIISIAYHQALGWRGSADAGTGPACSFRPQSRSLRVTGPPRQQQEVLTLVCLGGYSQREVARLLHLDPAAVTDAVNSAVHRLSRELPAAS